MKLLKTYLKPFAALVLACILLLFGQAMCDLTLPNLMSDIVNTGIQLGGVNEAAPAVLNRQAVERRGGGDVQKRLHAGGARQR